MQIRQQFIAPSQTTSNGLSKEHSLTMAKWRNSEKQMIVDAPQNIARMVCNVVITATADIHMTAISC
jgi:hypothetical protein